MNSTLSPQPKWSLDGAQRACSPVQTLERIAPFFDAAGITRVADITGLDRIGIPVALCIRPDSRSLAVDSGKGPTIAAAMASAAMEGMERVTCEQASFPIVRSAANGIENAEWDFPMLIGAYFDREREIDWVAGQDLFSGQDVLVPRRCVGLDVFGEDPIAERALYSTTNGLASGNTREEAIANALYEVIERDATALMMVRPGAGRVIKQESLPWPSVAGLLEKIRAAGCGVTIFDCTDAAIAVPTFMAVLFDREEKGVGVFKGYGAHLSPEVAMCRAVCEAAQARLVLVAGARDDISHERYSAYLRMSLEEDLSRWDLPANTLTNVADGSGSSFREDIGELMARLEAADFKRAIMYDFDAFKVRGAHVVRVLVPGLEGYLTTAMALGPRALKAQEEEK